MNPALNRVTPSKAKKLYTNIHERKSRYFSEQQPNVTASFYARKHQNYSPLAPMLEKPHSPEITTDARISTFSRI